MEITRLAQDKIKGLQQVAENIDCKERGRGRWFRDKLQRKTLGIRQGAGFGKFQTSFYSDPTDAVFKALGVQ